MCFLQALYNPLVKRLGYEYFENDSADTTLLRTRAIHQAALAEDQEYIIHYNRRLQILSCYVQCTERTQKSL
jgi:hypothetical protein